MIGEYIQIIRPMELHNKHYGVDLSLYLEKDYMQVVQYDPNSIKKCDNIWITDKRESVYRVRKLEEVLE